MEIYRVDGSDECDPDEYDGLSTDDIDVIFYTYESGSYDGDGEAIIRKGGKWYRVNLSHCSCYGPWDSHNSYLNSFQGYDTLTMMRDKSSDELNGDLAMLYQLAEGWLKKQEKVKSIADDDIKIVVNVADAIVSDYELIAVEDIERGTLLFYDMNRLDDGVQNKDGRTVAKWVKKESGVDDS